MTAPAKYGALRIDLRNGRIGRVIIRRGGRLPTYTLIDEARKQWVVPAHLSAPKRGPARSHNNYGAWIWRTQRLREAIQNAPTTPGAST